MPFVVRLGFRRRAFGMGLAVIILAGCSGEATGLRDGALPPQQLFAAAQGLDKIKHVVIVIQENRSVDNLFQGFPGADTRSFGRDSDGRKITLKPIPLETTWDVAHSAEAFFEACNGTGSYPGTHCRMNGFNKEYHDCGHGGYPACPYKYPQYAYVPAAETKLYFEMAQQYVFGDRMFVSNFDESSFVAHQYLIAGQASSTVNFPATNEWGCEGGPSDTIPVVTQERVVDYNDPIPVCLKNLTLGEELDGAGVSWKYYTAAVPQGDGAFWNAYSAVKRVYYGRDWTRNIISPQTVFFTDVSGGNLPAVSWITPTCENSDHASCGSNTGPAWVTSIVNAIGQSKYWKSTAIFITWDDPGGWYDHVPPKMLDYDGLGFRVPFIVISPYAKQAYVSHADYEHASLLRFVEDRWGLKSLAASDARALSPAGDCFDFTQPPRKFQVIQSTMGKDYFMHRPLDLRPPDNE